MVRLLKVALTLFLSSSALYWKVNSEYGVMTAIWRRYFRIFPLQGKVETVMQGVTKEYCPTGFAT